MKLEFLLKKLDVRSLGLFASGIRLSQALDEQLVRDFTIPALQPDFGQIAHRLGPVPLAHFTANTVEESLRRFEVACSEGGRAQLGITEHVIPPGLEDRDGGGDLFQLIGAGQCIDVLFEVRSE